MLPGFAPLMLVNKAKGPEITITKGSSTRSDGVAGTLEGYNLSADTGYKVIFNPAGSLSGQPIFVTGIALEEACKSVGESSDDDWYLAWSTDNYAKLDVELQKYTGFLFRGVRYSLPARGIDGFQQGSRFVIGYTWASNAPPFELGGTLQMVG